MIRTSGTEPVLRVYSESNTQKRWPQYTGHCQRDLNTTMKNILTIALLLFLHTLLQAQNEDATEIERTLSSTDSDSVISEIYHQLIYRIGDRDSTEGMPPKEMGVKFIKPYKFFENSQNSIYLER